MQNFAKKNGTTSMTTSTTTTNLNDSAIAVSTDITASDTYDHNIGNEISTIAAIAYFSSYTLLVIILSIHIHRTETYEKKKDYLKAIWYRRGIYGQILAHLYDTATDIAVLIQWYILANDNIDYESIDMHILFWTSIGFLIFYRFISSCFACFTAVDRDGLINKHDAIINYCLGILDIYIIKTVYLSLKYGHTEATPQQKAIQLLEYLYSSHCRKFCA